MTGSLAMPRPSAPDTRPAAVPPVSNTRLAVVMLITGEMMLFAGLIGMYLIFRLSAAAWPPPDLPRLPLGITAFNTVVLFASLVPMSRALAAARADRPDAAARAVAQTTALGVLFLAIQGIEWFRLVAHGLKLSSGTYGATFYVVIGTHAVHVLAAVVWLATLTLLARWRPLTARRHAGLEMCTIYWYFVCGLWAVLFPLVYIY
jgi:cytochrome c oxidase subunit III